MKNEPFCHPILLLLAAQPRMAQVPTPESVLGHKPGDDFYLATYDDALGYFRKLAAASKRIKLVEVGKTTQGRDWFIAFISNPENLAQLDHYKDISRRLAVARGISEEQARTLAREMKPIIHIDGGLHASEVANHQHTIQLGYDLVASEEPRIQSDPPEPDRGAVVLDQSRRPEHRGQLVPARMSARHTR